ncbi:uncharacterized protein EV420DRAFT_647379 [Desarmillaria tabescens]|uniref:Secreted protein n=1 Tax=Armillaria tabescens TaxID=1929756 RepID=A0AA39T5Z3_ARMTA|nr:uncharacterized protein EV420DRAFT_647379 [Desarmillaria tabescens]KAK0466766.1 hypothetical protein EV420DRAFT_647379 [Desarmillaria tabescens]
MNHATVVLARILNRGLVLIVGCLGHTLDSSDLRLSRRTILNPNFSPSSQSDANLASLQFFCTSSLERVSTGDTG